MILKIYTTLQSNNFIYFLREAELMEYKGWNNVNKMQDFSNFLFLLINGDKIQYLGEDE